MSSSCGNELFEDCDGVLYQAFAPLLEPTVLFISLSSLYYIILTAIVSRTIPSVNLFEPHHRSISSIHTGFCVYTKLCGMGRRCVILVHVDFVIMKSFFLETIIGKWRLYR